MHLTERIDEHRPKRLLALDGGGIRGALTIEVLAGIEELLRAELGAGDDFVLADYFDYVGGTSTGAIIAACIAWGMPVATVRAFYRENAEEMFERSRLIRRWRHKYEDQALSRRLEREFEGATLGSERLRTLLMMVMRNATTDSPWTISNNPRAKYNEPGRPDCNLSLPLWQLVRASTAAPVYFPPEVVDTGRHEFIFVDGGVTPYNNPAFQLFLMATLEPYRLQWPAGEDRMLLVSVGTGVSPRADAHLQVDDMNILYNASSVPGALMFASLTEQDLLCRAFGRCRAGGHIDNEIGDLRNVAGPVEPRLFTYMRYNAELTEHGLEGLGLGDVDPAAVRSLDSIDHVDDLLRIGRAVAERRVALDHFEGFLSAAP